MVPVGPLKSKRLPESVRRQVELAGASAWEALVEAHTAHALRFVTLMATRMPFDEAVSRYLAEMDVRDPMASSIRSRVLIALEHAARGGDDRPSLRFFEAEGAEADEGGDGLRRFRPDVLMKGIARKVRETGELEQWIALAIARAEEGIIRAHIDNATTFVAILHGHADLDEAVEEYIDVLRVSGGRAQAVFQRTMAQLADLHLPDDESVPEARAGTRPEPGE